MKIIPFVLKETKETLTMTSLKLFLAHAGKGVWTTEEANLSTKDIEQEYLLPNGLIPKRMFERRSILYIEIDSNKTRFEDFYTWDEALCNTEKPECWRQFFFFKDEQGGEWFSSRLLQGENELEGRPIHEYYEEILACAKS
jgi:hypothetical protein